MVTCQKYMCQGEFVLFLLDSYTFSLPSHSAEGSCARHPYGELLLALGRPQKKCVSMAELSLFTLQRILASSHDSRKLS